MEQKIIKFYMGNKAYAENNWLSNMWPVDISVNGMVFSCVESAFQAFKFEDISEQKRFVGINGFTAKKLGGRNGGLKSFIGNERWNQHRCWVMAKFLWLKFGNPQCGGIYKELHDKLISTGDAYLLEDGNDNFWGGKENMLGKLLMLLREYLQHPKNTWDIFSSGCDILTNLNNCQVRKDGKAVQGAGLAAAFEKNPTFKEDNAAFSKYLRENSAQPGDIFSTDRVLYAMTKLQPSKDEEITLKTIMSLAEKFPRIMTEKHAGKSLAIPRVGSGLAGGNWLDIFPYLLSGFSGYSNGRVVMSGVELYPYGASISPTER